MIPILISIIIFLAAVIAALVIYAVRETKRHGTGVAGEFIGICKSAIETASQKEARKERTLALLRERGEASNFQIRQALVVSNRTAVRYLDELEKEGKVRQVGATGQSVVYRLK